MSEYPRRSRDARALAERALVRVIAAYGEMPEFVLLGGLVPDLLCSQSPRRHVGTTDVDVQANLEIQGGAVNGTRLEGALKDAGFTPDPERVWRWQDRDAHALVVKVEFLADLIDEPSQAIVNFDGCESLGAVNLRGTGFASQDWTVESITAEVDGAEATVQLRVASLPAYLLAKTHAARGRGMEKDWYDVAYVLLHNDDGGPAAAGQRVYERFGDQLAGATTTALDELRANFADMSAQGAVAYASTMFAMHSYLDEDVLANDAVAAVDVFTRQLQLRD